MPKIKIKDAIQTQRGVCLVGDIPNAVVQSIAKQIFARKAIGVKDIAGDDFAEMFAKAVKGTHHRQPIGLVDISKCEIGWSSKTVKGQGDVFVQERVRLVTGRNSIDCVSTAKLSLPRCNLAQSLGFQPVPG